MVIPSYGAMAAIGVLAGLVLALRTAPVTGVAPNQLWNLCVVSLFAALIGSRLLLFALNWRDIVRHPAWMLSLAMIHHPLLGATGGLIGLLAAWAFARWHRMSLADTADALAAPVALGLACEQFGALMAGSGYGTETAVRWAVVYVQPLARRWSGTPLGDALHPVQAYAGIAFLTLALLVVVILPARRQRGDASGVALTGLGLIVFLTEIWRDWEGRGTILHGALDGPQVAGLVLVIAGAMVLRERHGAPNAAPRPAGAAHA